MRLPEEMEFATAASLGCRFVTSFRAIVDQGRVTPGEWVAVHGCGGVGLSAIMIASSMGANVIAIDLAAEVSSVASLPPYQYIVATDVGIVSMRILP